MRIRRRLWVQAHCVGLSVLLRFRSACSLIDISRFHPIHGFIKRGYGLCVFHSHLDTWPFIRGCRSDGQFAFNCFTLIFNTRAYFVRCIMRSSVGLINDYCIRHLNTTVYLCLSFRSSVKVWSVYWMRFDKYWVDTAFCRIRNSVTSAYIHEPKFRTRMGIFKLAELCISFMHRDLTQRSIHFIYFNALHKSSCLL